MSVTATIRMYNQLDLGDCFLLNFKTETKEQFLLIDFGSYKNGNEKREKIIAEDILKTAGDHDLTIALTHQHKDHLSGFLSAKDILKKKKVEKLWLSFLDSENSKQGQELRELTEKYWKKNQKIVSLLESKFTDPQVDKMLFQKKGFDLFAEGQIGGPAVSSLLEIAENKVEYLTPGDNFFLPGLDEEVKVYVLGPPTDSKLLGKLNPVKDEEVTSLNASLEVANLDLSGTLMLDALSSLHAPQANRKDCDFPFNRQYRQNTDPLVMKRYNDPNNDWRRIDHEWLSEVGRLSLHMDKLTNNSSLVLAFELVRSKKVLLFVGDAQIGNWQSWFKVKFKDSDVSAQDLLARTVVYKAGHHSSENATLRQGLNMMNEKELIILIPIDEKTSTGYHFKMLKGGMLAGYNRKSQGRVFRSDTVEQNDANFGFSIPFAKIKDLKHIVKVNTDGTAKGHLSIDISISDERILTAEEKSARITQVITEGIPENIKVEKVILKRNATRAKK